MKEQLQNWEKSTMQLEATIRPVNRYKQTVTQWVQNPDDRFLGKVTDIQKVTKKSE
jgi:hypothetical protein